MPERTNPQLLELQKLLADGLKSGTLKLADPVVPASPKPEAPLDPTLKELQDLLLMVHACEATGHCRLLRRKSTQSIALPYSGKLKLGAPVRK
eukprot:3935189-Rhodomonas_salina.1